MSYLRYDSCPKETVVHKSPNRVNNTKDFRQCVWKKEEKPFIASRQNVRNMLLVSAVKSLGSWSSGLRIKTRKCFIGCCKKEVIRNNFFVSVVLAQHFDLKSMLCLFLSDSKCQSTPFKKHFLLPDNTDFGYNKLCVFGKYLIVAFVSDAQRGSLPCNLGNLLLDA